MKFFKSLIAVLVLAVMPMQAQAAEAFNSFTNITDTQATDEFTLYRTGVGMRNWTPSKLLIDSTDSSLADPNADRLLFWDDSVGKFQYLTLGTNLTITGTTLDAAGGGSGPGVTDGDKGDIVVTGTGANWNIDSSVLSTFGRTLISGADAAGTRTTIGLGTGDSPTFAGLTATGNINASNANIIGTSTGTQCLTVGPNGTTNPGFQVACNKSAGNTGVLVSMGSNGDGTNGRISATSPSSSATLEFASKGTSGEIRAFTPTFAVRPLATDRLLVKDNRIEMTAAAATDATLVRLKWTGTAQSGLTASTDFNHIYFNLGQTYQHLVGSITQQRDFRFTPMIHTASAASVIDSAEGFSVDGPPNAGTNVTLTSSAGIVVNSAALTGVTNGYGAKFNAPTGATNNYAAFFGGGPVRMASGLIQPIRVVTASGNITVTNDDFAVIVNKTTGAATQVTLPTCGTGNAGITFVVKDGKKDSATNNITVVGTIDGATNDVISNNGASQTYQCDGAGTYWKE